MKNISLKKYTEYPRNVHNGKGKLKNIWNARPSPRAGNILHGKTFMSSFSNLEPNLMHFAAVKPL